MKNSSFEREGHSLLTLRNTAHQETTWDQIKGMQALHTPWSLLATPPLNHSYDTPHQSLQVGTYSFWGHEPTVSPFAWQSNKAILFHSKLCLPDSIQHRCTEAEFSASSSLPCCKALYRQPECPHQWQLAPPRECFERQKERERDLRWTL